MALGLTKGGVISEFPGVLELPQGSHVTREPACVVTWDDIQRVLNEYNGWGRGDEQDNFLTLHSLLAGKVRAGEVFKVRSLWVGTGVYRINLGLPMEPAR